MRPLSLLVAVLVAFPVHGQSGALDPTFGTGGQVTLVQGADPFLGASRRSRTAACLSPASATGPSLCSH